MLQSLSVLTSNYIINVGFMSWFLAQLIKTVLNMVETKRFDAERLIGSGGMPSSHSALVCSIAMAMARKTGFSSAEFALAIALAGIVMYDAMGVRRAAGEQAKVLNKMIFNFQWFEKSTPQEDNDNSGKLENIEADDEPVGEPIRDKELKEYIGHTPMEVLGGALLGILVAIIIPVK